MGDVESAKGGSTVTLEQWQSENGYDPKKRRYRRTSADDTPRAFPKAHKMSRPQDPQRHYSRGR